MASNCEIEKLEQQLAEAEAKQLDAFTKYMYYECADRGYQYAEAHAAQRRWFDAQRKVDALKRTLNYLKGGNDE